MLQIDIHFYSFYINFKLRREKKNGLYSNEIELFCYYYYLDSYLEDYTRPQKRVKNQKQKYNNKHKIYEFKSSIYFPFKTAPFDRSDILTHSTKSRISFKNKEYSFGCLYFSSV
jgi:hypothetical protein